LRRGLHRRRRRLQRLRRGEHPGLLRVPELLLRAARELRLNPCDRHTHPSGGGATKVLRPPLLFQFFLQLSMSILIDAVARTWDKQEDYARRLLADLSDEDMVSQPVPGVTLNHPAWTLSHLTVYSPVLSAILRAEPFEDPINSPFGRDSSPK